MTEKAKVLAEDGTKIEASSWLWKLQFVSSLNLPVFGGKLESGSWQDDEFLKKGVEQGWLEIVPKGFLITEKGREELKANGLHPMLHPSDLAK